MKGSQKNKLRKRKRDMVKDFLKKKAKNLKGIPKRRPMTQPSKRTPAS
ncbi:hypothetical protein BpOF4_01920 [Alkalihalophilus pseudofirmus OF4]|jgi:hypothetical protein|uniref:Uncharacterized protein n=2 Tax=Alkalihalophilus TaxID=2893060 RepID=D3FV25_ALKPO|nr:hypothetical protein BpOF4_01920 [Alkalihalophilus pseudofirmus OF4]ERN52897.1 hypothetical protein A33I_14535 [Alkalihalophilus marmarensis DSM 21297]